MIECKMNRKVDPSEGLLDYVTFIHIKNLIKTKQLQDILEIKCSLWNGICICDKNKMYFDFKFNCSDFSREDTIKIGKELAKDLGIKFNGLR